jgi:hypothetical protein
LLLGILELLFLRRLAPGIPDNLRIKLSDHRMKIAALNTPNIAMTARDLHGPERRSIPETF